MSHPRMCSLPHGHALALVSLSAFLSHGLGKWTTHPLSTYWMLKRFTCISSLTPPSEAVPIIALLYRWRNRSSESLLGILG